jgi:DNA-binding CsgD family transcriptional regulator
MSRGPLDDVVTCLRETATRPDLWPTALPLITTALGGVGAACFASNDRTSGLEWAYFFGPTSVRKTDYVEYYASLDPYMPLLAAPEQAGWAILSDCLPENLLRHSEWYQDFVRPSGISDVAGVQLCRTQSYRVFFGVHYPAAHSAPATRTDLLRDLLGPLQETARLECLQRTFNRKALFGDWALEHLDDAVFLTHDGGRVVGMNAAAERLLAASDALTIRRGRLVATEAVEAKQLAALIIKVSREKASQHSAERMLVGGNNARRRQIIAVFALAGRLSVDETPLAIIRVSALLDQSSPGPDLSGLFGFSVAERRLTRGLMQGKTLQELTVEFGVQMPTLRTQLRSVLRKCGVSRQVDLIQVLLRAL